MPVITCLWKSQLLLKAWCLLAFTEGIRNLQQNSSHLSVAAPQPQEDISQDVSLCYEDNVSSRSPASLHVLSLLVSHSYPYTFSRSRVTCNIDPSSNPPSSEPHQQLHECCWEGSKLVW